MHPSAIFRLIYFSVQNQNEDIKLSVSKRVNNIGVSPTMKVAAKAKELKAQGLNVIDLSVGEPDFPTPENIKEAAKNAIDSNQTRYTINSGIPQLRQAISDYLKNNCNLEYSINDIIVSSGAKQSLYNTILSIVDPGDEVIIPAPYWVSYPHMVSMAQGESIVIETSQESNFKISPEQLEKAITPKTKALILCNPSNPTGSAYTENELKAIAEVVRKYDMYVISDEIYEQLVYDDFKLVSFASFDDEIKAKTITVNGVSKTYAMTGWRIGFTAGPSDVINGINKIQSHSTSNAASISQYAALEAFSGPQDAVPFMKGEFAKRRNYLHEELNKIEGISCNLAEGAFYLFPNIKGLFGKSNGTVKIENSTDFALYLLNEAQIAAVPGSAFGAEGFIRLSYATSLENLEDAVNRIKDVLAKLN